MTLTLVASHDLMTVRLALHLYELLKDLTAGSTVLLRQPLHSHTNTGVFERVAAEIAASLALNVEFCRPEEGRGRAGVYERDYSMVERSTKVVAFFSPERVMEGGTAHVVEAATARGVETEAWTVLAGGSLERVGDWP